MNAASFGLLNGVLLRPTLLKSMAKHIEQRMLKKLDYAKWLIIVNIEQKE